MNTADDFTPFVKKVKSCTTINSDDVRNYHKLSKILEFLKTKQECPNLRKSQICKKLNISESTLRRHMLDLNMSSFYRHDVPANKPKKKVSRMERAPVSGSEKNRTRRTERGHAAGFYEETTTATTGSSKTRKVPTAKDIIDDMIKNPI